MSLITAHASEPSAPRSTNSVKGSIARGSDARAELLLQHCDAEGPARVCGKKLRGIVGKALRPSLAARVFSARPAAACPLFLGADRG
jgi:hypothetical protein